MNEDKIKRCGTIADYYGFDLNKLDPKIKKQIIKLLYKGPKFKGALEKVH